MKKKIKLLYSFPLKIGAGQICNTAWQQVEELSKLAIDIHLFTGSQSRQFTKSIEIVKTLHIGSLRIPNKLTGIFLACRIHDYLASRYVAKNHGSIDIIHGWPLASLRTIRVAKKYGIPFLLERPNAHTQFAFDEVKKECEKHGFSQPKGHEHNYNPKRLSIELNEYNECTRLLCPSDFVKRTFIEKGFEEKKLLRHQYGCDPDRFFPLPQRPTDNKFRAIFAGWCAPRKGLHYALNAWFDSGAHKVGTLYICGSFIPEYKKSLSALLSHKSIKVLGHCNEIDKFFQKCDVFILPSIEEGSALVTYEAKRCGCILLVSDASGAIARHGHDSLIHTSRDVATLTRQLQMLISEPATLARLRENSLSETDTLTWKFAATTLMQAYSSSIRTHSQNESA